MTARSGERAWKSGEFHCKTCSDTVYVKQGDRIPDCPCGANEFDERTGEPPKQEPRHYDR